MGTAVKGICLLGSVKCHIIVLLLFTLLIWQLKYIRFYEQTTLEESVQSGTKVPSEALSMYIIE